MRAWLVQVATNHALGVRRRAAQIVLMTALAGRAPAGRAPAAA